MQRRDLMWLAGLTAPGLCLSLPALAAERELRIGFQKYGSLVLLKERGLLEQRLAPQGWTVTWTEFPGGPQLLEALNVGAIDFGTTGEAPPIFAQAAGAPLLYVGYEPPAPQGEAILVPEGLADRRRRRAEGPQGRASTRARTSSTCWSGRWRPPASPTPTSSRSTCRRPTPAPRSSAARSTPG